jgi:hypothetical protein
MRARRTHDAVATLGTYKDRDGNEKKRYATCGTAFTDDEGRVSIKLDTIPVSPDWSGWLSLYPIKDRGQDSAAPQTRDNDGENGPF